jgi:hypothetical protein
MTATINGYNANLINDILFGPGVVRIGSTNIGVTKGPPKFDPGWTLENVMFDGKDAPIYLLDRKFYGEPIMSFTILEFGPAASGNQVAKLEAGSTAVDSGTTPNTKTTVTPRVGRTLFVAGDYLSDVYIINPRAIVTGASIKGYASVHFAKALVKKWDLEPTDKEEVKINVEIGGRKDMTAGTTADAPYDIVYWETLP